jgi:hypothetical protein
VAEVSQFQRANIGWVIRKNSNGRWIVRKANPGEFQTSYATKEKANEMAKRFNK